MSSEDKKSERLDITKWMPYSPLGFLALWLIKSLADVLDAITKGAESLKSIWQNALAGT